MADEELGDLNLSQYTTSGRWLQNSNRSWMRYSHATNFDEPNSGSNVPERFSSQKTGGNCYDSESSGCSRSPSTCAQMRGRSSLYYSPPGTSYTIVERPVATSSVHQQYTDPPPGSKLPVACHQGRSLSHSPRAGSKTTGTKRPMSPEEVLNLFGSTPGKGKACSRRSQSPTRSSTPTPRPHYYYQNTHDDAIVRTVTMVRQPDSSHGFGVCVKGGKDSDDGRLGVYISRVEEGSIAERVGLKPGDFILEANGIPFNTITHEEALKMLKSCRKLSMTIQSPNALSQSLSLASSPPVPSQAGGPWLMRQSYSWMDREGRPVSPPLEYARAAPPPAVLAPKWVCPPSRPKESGATRKVDLNIETGQSLGLMIRGGLEYNLGIFITGVDKESVAEKAGLMVGDHILEVNGQSFLDVTHDEAVNQLKIHKRMTLLVKDVGKVPHSCTAYEDYHWQPCFSNTSPDHILPGKDYCPVTQMVQEKARVLLNQNELLSLSYYQEEYATGHMTIEAFVTVLLELLNTPEKHNLLTELREVILPQDRVRFDDLVYRRTPHEGDRHSHRRKGCGVPISGSNFSDYLDTNECFATSRPSKIPVLAEGVPLDGEGYNTPSEDSGVCLGDGRTNERASWIAATPPIYRNQPSELALSNGDCTSISQGSGGGRKGLHKLGEGQMNLILNLTSYNFSWISLLRSSVALTIFLAELTHKLSRSFDMKEEQRFVDSGGGTVRRHQSMQRLSRADSGEGPEEEDPLGGPVVVQDQQGNLRITVSKSKPILGIAIEGGANTRHPLPRIINIHENGAAYEAGGLEVGQLILEVDGRKVEGMHHQDIARLIAESFARKERHEIEFLVVEAKKSNLEPKPTALIFLEA